MTNWHCVRRRAGNPSLSLCDLSQCSVWTARSTGIRWRRAHWAGDQSHVGELLERGEIGPGCFVRRRVGRQSPGTPHLGHAFATTAQTVVQAIESIVQRRHLIRSGDSSAARSRPESSRRSKHTRLQLESGTASVKEQWSVRNATNRVQRGLLTSGWTWTAARRPGRCPSFCWGRGPSGIPVCRRRRCPSG